MGRRAEDALTLALLAAAVAVAAFLRFDGLGEPSYWLDEILHQQLTTKLTANRWWQWFGRLEEEHAGLYYLTQLATRVFGTTEFAGRLAAATFGLATIPLLWFVPLERRALGASLVLLAVSPLHVYYSREARGYALIMFLTAALIAILMRGRSLAALCAVLLAMLYTSAVASTIVASAAAVCFLVAIVDREHRRWYAWATACAAIVLALFRAIYAARPMYDTKLPGFPPLDWDFATTLGRMFSVSAFGQEIAGRTAAATVIFALIGAIAIARNSHRQAIVLIGMTVLPFAITLLALRIYDHFFAVRYVVASLIGYLLLASVGIWSAAAKAAAFKRGGESRRAAYAITLIIAILTAAQAWPSARTEPFQKLDWRGIASTLRQYVRPGDVILAAEPWSDVSLRHYFGEVPGVRLVLMSGVGITEVMVNGSPASWLVSAGASTDTSIRTWMCRYPIVLANELENFRLHYAPSLRDFVQHRARPADLRAFSTALGDDGFTIKPDDEPLFGEGWANAEGTFRWAVGKRATVVFPRNEKRDRTIGFHAYPATPQTMRVSLNGHAVGAVALPNEWRDYTITVPAAFWNEGLNTLAFEFENSVVPSEQDRRELAVSFQRIWIDRQKPAGAYPVAFNDCD
ncbi:MAG TPA: hypothetical protein VEK79_14785 [Thermoanaerobaculia bacterium]|nr:hypothetical protein [Thermoanaerobaculia bacterium]